MSFRIGATILLLVVLSALGFGMWWRQSHDVKAAPPPPSDREDYKSFEIPGKKKAGSKNEAQDRANEPPADAKQ